MQCDIGDVVGLPMVRHIIIWKLKDTVVNKEETMKSIKDALEGLVGKIAGLEKMSILIDKLPSSSGDLMMDSLFTDNGALKNYQNNPLHLEVANGLVRPNVDVRLSFDFEV
ncbi:MAG: Dabb family protein [Candidatus Coproplasma sp.]